MSESNGIDSVEQSPRIRFNNWLLKNADDIVLRGAKVRFPLSAIDWHAFQAEDNEASLFLEGKISVIYMNSFDGENQITIQRIKNKSQDLYVWSSRRLKPEVSSSEK